MQPHMSISPKFFETLKKRNNPMEIYYYLIRCLYNAKGKDRDKFLKQADQLAALLITEENP